MSVRLAIASIGPEATDVLGHDGPIRIAAVFARSILLENEHGLICVVEPGLGNGPLNAVLGGDAPPVWTCLVPLPGSMMQIESRSIVGAKIEFDAASPACWPPPMRPTVAGARDLARAREVITAVLANRAPPGGMACAVGGPKVAHATAGERAAQRAVHALCELLRQLLASHDPAAEDCDPQGLAVLGLGPGLTPAGDDLLVGVLIALRRFGRPAAAGALARAVERLAPDRTSRFSARLLHWAGRGLAGEPLMQAIDAIAAGEPLGLVAAIEQAVSVGHSSGSDALAGVLLALQFPVVG